MAIYSLNRKPITRTKHRPGFAAAHARYILRPGACSTVIALLPPFIEATRRDVAAWLSYAERTDRRNARVCDRVMIALPVELRHREERVGAIRAFCEAVSGGLIPYVAGVHDMAGDADNPHAHCIFRDRSFANGRPVRGLRELGSTEWIREEWERAANDALYAAGFYETIDRRSNVRRGIGVKPGSHRGPLRAA